MEPTTSWKALVDPGAADDFFEIDGLPAFDARARSQYSPGNALWLAETSRLVYRVDAQSRRGYFAERAGLEEIRFFDRGATQGALLRGRGFALLAFRGTLGARDWLSDLDCPTVPWEGGGKVHQGFKRQLDRVWEEVRHELDEVDDVPVFYTGHSLGAALATLAAARRFREDGAPPAALYTFGSPRVGTAELARAFPAAFLHCRVVNDRDVVATVPPRRLSEQVFGAAYHHVGVRFHLHDGALERGAPDDDGSPSFLDDLAGRWREELARIREAGVWSCIEPLMDHAPVNYTAAIEKAGA